jgi:hypothetical protein
LIVSPLKNFSDAFAESYFLIGDALGKGMVELLD